MLPKLSIFNDSWFRTQILPQQEKKLINDKAYANLLRLKSLSTIYVTHLREVSTAVIQNGNFTIYYSNCKKYRIFKKWGLTSRLHCRSNYFSKILFLIVWWLLRGLILTFCGQNCKIYKTFQNMVALHVLIFWEMAFLVVAKSLRGSYEHTFIVTWWKSCFWKSYKFYSFFHVTSKLDHVTPTKW